MPPSLVAPTCSMLGQLTEHLNCTIVLCTATQPMWERRTGFAEGLHTVRQAAPASLELFRRLRRTQVTWPAASEPPWDWPRVADKIPEDTAALCVVNTKRAALQLFEELKARGRMGLVHLSTNMCPAHRLKILDEVRRRLLVSQPCTLVSTQLIEAGVDVDFPIVFRQLAPLEAIVQAAGRCNREGQLNDAAGNPGGRVIVFRTVGDASPNDPWYRAGIQIVEQLLRAGYTPDIHNPADLEDYFRRLYRSGELDAKRIQELRGRMFATIWRGDPGQANLGRYRIVEEDTTPVVVVKWKERHDHIEKLLKEYRRSPTRSLRRRLSQFQVNLRDFEIEQSSELLMEEPVGVFSWRGAYDDATGLIFRYASEDLVV
ncbi:MAG: hypothetical protein KY475_09765 [Planctomycetes bacterium]|nr:hypothetical protein [Planctomycetota bacterium]